MRLDEHGLVRKDTEVVNDGAFVAYAEVDAGPWTLDFGRARGGGGVLLSRDETFTLSGPFIENDGERELSEARAASLVERMGGWDYVERCESEQYEP